ESSLPELRSHAPRLLPPLLEARDAAAARGSALSARIGRMTVRAGVHDQLAPGRAGGERAAAGRTADARERQLRMYLLQRKSPPSRRAVSGVRKVPTLTVKRTLRGPLIFRLNAPNEGFRALRTTDF